jgi:hypothetical protein
MNQNNLVYLAGSFLHRRKFTNSFATVQHLTKQFFQHKNIDRAMCHENAPCSPLSLDCATPQIERVRDTGKDNFDNPILRGWLLYLHRGN